MNQRGYVWQDWKAALSARHGSAQSTDVEGVVHCWFVDGNDEHRCTLWRGEVPYAIEATYAQAQNDADLAEYDSGAIEFNRAVEQKNYDGRVITQPVTLGSGQWHFWHGEGDDPGAGTVGGGQAFEATQSTAGDNPVTWVYRDPVWIAGGSFRYQGAEMGDHVSFVIYAPATGITPSAGGNTGNCNLHSSGILLPAAGDGAYDVDLATANPVPTSDFAPYTGFWNYTLPTDMKGRGTITPGAPGQSKYHLIPADIPLDQFVHKERLLGTGESFYEPQNINVSLCLPGWQFTCTLHNANGSHTVEAVWRVLVSRYWTTM
jgi:hypothetical protein